MKGDTCGWTRQVLPALAKVTPVVSVFLLIDQPLVRAGLRSVFDPLADLDLVGEAADLPGAMSALRLLLHAPDVVVVEARTYDEALHWVRALVRSERSPRVVVIGAAADGSSVLRTLLEGANAYLRESDPADALVQTVRTVAAGVVVLSEEVAHELVRRLRPQLEPAYCQLIANLTERERAVLKLLTRGCSNSGIAGELLLSEATVKKHLSHVLHKLGVNTRLQAGLIAYQVGLGPTGPLEIDAEVP